MMLRNGFLLWMFLAVVFCQREAVAQQQAGQLLQQLEQARQNKDADGENRQLMALGNFYRDAGEYRQAINFFEQAIELNQRIGNPNAIAHYQFEAGMAHEALGNYPQALEFLQQALEIRQQMKDRTAACYLHLNIGRLYLQQGNRRKAIAALESCEPLALELNETAALTDTYRLLSELYDAMGKNNRALEYQKKYINLFKMEQEQEQQVKDQQAQQHMAAKNRQLQQAGQQIDSLSVATEQNRQELEAQQQAIQLLNQQKEIQQLKLLEKESRLQAHQTMVQALAGGSAVVLVAGILLFVAFSQSRKARKMLQVQHEEILQKSEEISQQRDQLVVQSRQLETAMARVNASMSYARRIQTALLPNGNARPLLGQGNSFVFFKPRELVSGDFYWYSQQQHLHLFAVADCTGHGVPGSLMAMLCIGLFDRAVENQGLLMPDKILESVNYQLRKVLKQEQTRVTDGMDVSVICWDSQAGKLYFAGAKNPVLLVSAGEATLVKGDKFPIGGHFNHNGRQFTLHEFSIDKPVQVYLYSDGFQDQFGGPENRKYMSKNFRKLLQQIHHLPAQQQQERLQHELQAWLKASAQPQLDDITIAGIQLGQG